MKEPLISDPGFMLQDRPILEHISPLILRWVRGFGVPERDCEDVKQNVLLAVLRSFPSFDHGSSRSFWPWLKTIAYRIARDYLGLARHRREQLDGANGEQLDAGSPDPEARLISAAASLAVQRTLESIDLPRRKVLVLHDLDGLPMIEIAATQGISVNTAYTRLRLARADFRAAWRRKTATTGHASPAPPEKSFTLSP